MALLDDFQRVNREHPCPICGKPDWCLVSRDDPANPAKVICTRVESSVRFADAGWLHSLREDGQKSKAPFRITFEVHRDSAIDFASLMTHNADGGDQQLAVEAERGE